MDDEYKIPTYPLVMFLAKWGGAIAVVLALCVLAGGVVLAALGWSPLFVPLGIAAAIVVWVLVASYAEVLRMISDTLMPR